MDSAEQAPETTDQENIVESHWTYSEANWIFLVRQGKRLPGSISCVIEQDQTFLQSDQPTRKRQKHQPIDKD
jgi:hypothetical protein